MKSESELEIPRVEDKLSIECIEKIFGISPPRPWRICKINQNGTYDISDAKDVVICEQVPEDRIVSIVGAPALIEMLLEHVRGLQEEVQARDFIIRSLAPGRDPDNVVKEQIENKHFGPR